uniref:Uncharacterized protein n=1 Tax=Lactuca sativa TaxID=4236 RepID=A0A9R1VI90_LACSA|nr:hypothetical protein LSAT_V11C500294480 [Lactuca sativa]
MQLWSHCSDSYILEQKKPWETLQYLYSKGKGPLCKFIGWVNDYDQDCDCMAFRMKLEEQNRKLKLYLVISWVFFLFQSLYIKCRFSNEAVSILLCVFCIVICIMKKPSIPITICCVIIMWCYQLVFKFNENVVFVLRFFQLVFKFYENVVLLFVL